MVIDLNSEALASEILENIQEMFTQKDMPTDMLSVYTFTITLWCVIRHKK